MFFLSLSPYCQVLGNNEKSIAGGCKQYGKERDYKKRDWNFIIDPMI